MNVFTLASIPLPVAIVLSFGIALSFSSCAATDSSVDAMTAPTRLANRETSSSRAPASDALSAPKDSSLRPTAADKKVLIVSLSPDGQSSTAIIVSEIADALGATVLDPDEVTPGVFSEYPIIGFASGIFDQRHHRRILESAASVPGTAGKCFFIVSTSGVSREYAVRHSIDDPHAALRNIIEDKGGRVIGEFNCPGLNNNSFLKYFGGMNRGRPNQPDREAARVFAARLLGAL